jgi:hypothetical protein
MKLRIDQVERRCGRRRHWKARISDLLVQGCISLWTATGGRGEAREDTSNTVHTVIEPCPKQVLLERSVRLPACYAVIEPGHVALFTAGQHEVPRDRMVRCAL